MKNLFSQRTLDHQTLLNNIFNISKVSEAIKWVAHLDGAMQYWQLTTPVELPENSNFKITFYVQGAEDAYEGLVENSNTSHTWIRLLPSSQSSNLQGYDGSLYFGGISQSELLIRDGLLHKISFIREVDKLYIQIDDRAPELARSSGAGAAWIFDRLGKFSSTYLHGVIHSFEVELESEVIVSIPLNNKEQGATQLATVGNINAFMPNYTEAVWRKP
jgi:hypothetical protein